MTDPTIDYDEALRGLVIDTPDGLVMDTHGKSLPEGTVLPDGLKTLYLNGGSIATGTVLPDGLEMLCLWGGGAARRGGPAGRAQAPRPRRRHSSRRDRAA